VSKETPVEGPTRFAERRSRPRWGTLVLIGLAHVLVLMGLVRAFAPDFTASVLDKAASMVTVTVYTPPPAEPSASPTPTSNEGAAGEEAKKAKAKDVAVPPRPKPKQTDAPQAASTGTVNESGARDEGAGTGAGGPGEGTGSGRGGQGAGGIPVTRPIKIAGDINDARDYPTPPGGREVRRGTEVVVYMTVGVDGRASNCRVTRPSPDPVADRITCELAVKRFRFKPAVDANGDPVPATYGWRQRWF
jgi:protein TonB